MNSTGNINELRTSLESLKKAGKTIGLVPTMGNLHDGHINLVKESLEKNDPPIYVGVGGVSDEINIVVTGGKTQGAWKVIEARRAENCTLSVDQWR